MVDVGGYKITNIYSPPSKRLQAPSIPVLFQPSFFAGDFNSSHTDWRYNIHGADGVCMAAWASLAI